MTKRTATQAALLAAGIAAIVATPAIADLTRAKKFSELTPKPPAGWRGSKAYPEFKKQVSAVLVTYTQRGGEGSVNLEIKDVVTKDNKIAAHKPKSFGMKATMIKGLKAGYEPCTVQPRKVRAYYVITGNYLVKLTCTETKNEIALKLLNAIDYKAIAAVK